MKQDCGCHRLVFRNRRFICVHCGYVWTLTDLAPVAAR